LTTRGSFPLPHRTLLRARLALRDTLDVPRAARHSFRWDVLAGACNGAYMGMVFPFVVRIARGDLAAPESAIAVLTAAPFIGNLLSPIWARQMEGRSKIPFVIGSWLPARSLLLLMPFVLGRPWLFVALVSGLQFIGTISTPAYTSLMRDIYPDRARGRLMGYVRVAVQALTFVSTLITGRLLDHGIPFGIVFPLAGLLGFCGALSFWRVRPLPEEVAAAEAAPPRVLSTREFVLDTLAVLRENVSYRWFALSVFAYGFGNLMVMPLYALYQVDVLHITNTQIANLANFTSLCSIFGFIFWGRFIDRHGAPITVLLGIVLFALVPIVYLLANSVNVLFFAAALSGLGGAGIELSYLQSILLYAERERTAQYQSLHSLLLGVRGVAAPLLGIPLMKALGFPPVFVLALLLMLVGGVMQWLAMQRQSD
jgi:MFS family permease